MCVCCKAPVVGRLRIHVLLLPLLEIRPVVVVVELPKQFSHNVIAPNVANCDSQFSFVYLCICISIYRFFFLEGFIWLLSH